MLYIYMEEQEKKERSFIDKHTYKQKKRIGNSLN